jgi:hypothetical protein
MSDMAASSELHGAEAAVEHRWPMAAAVVVGVILTASFPDRWSFGPIWLIPACECVLLVALVIGDPGRIDRRSNAMRIISIALVAVLVSSTLWNTGHLIDELITGAHATDDASTLLSQGVSVWFCNVLAFSLLFWELDAGGAPARAHGAKQHPDFAFPQHMNPALAAASWRPRYPDYLYLGITNAIALSPTDAMPLAFWAKGAMAVQSLISLAILSLVIARAVNVL